MTKNKSPKKIGGHNKTSKMKAKSNAFVNKRDAKRIGVDHIKNG